MLGIIKDMRSTLQRVANDNPGTSTARDCISAISRSRVPLASSPAPLIADLCGPMGRGR